MFLVNSCDNVEHLNVDTKGYLNAQPHTLMTTAQKEYMDFLTNTDQNRNNFRQYAQHWTNREFAVEDNYSQDSRAIGQSNWDDLYRDVLIELTTAKKAIEASNVTPNLASRKKNQVAILEIQIILAYQSLVDLFGNIPYTEALDFTSSPTPKYDDAETIYLDLATRLDVAINNLDISSDSFTSGDLYYNGNVASWKKLANSAKLKMGLHLGSQSMVEAAYLSGVISSNSDNALFPYFAVENQENPLFFILNQRTQIVPTSFLVDAMNAKSDPRMDQFFNPASKIAGVYVGYPYAEGNDNGLGYDDASNTNDKFRDATLPGVLFDYAETSLLLADAANKGYNVGLTAATHYVNGITATMEYWGVSGNHITIYLGRADVTYSIATADTQIAYELWLAYYNRGFEAWTEYRRLDSPILVAPPAAVTEANGKVPVRNIYPLNEATLNETNYNSAATAIGGDKMTTKIFWDVN
ncbi:SusD/RagB family nutrient-binding outer membrane lipoprotein [Tenacibaculum sp. Bg11-29]|nr:SusD/RagB family nutrient-binding outer membrane lipoprotein [Tenacibaculum sp. Bg11-29]